MKEKQTTIDIDYSESAVPKGERRSLLTMFMIMLGLPSSPLACGPVRSWPTAWILPVSWAP